MQYMLLIYITDEGEAAIADELQQEFEEAHQSIQAELRANGELVATSELSLTGARTVRQAGGKASFTDGPFAESKELVGGYYLVDCADLDRATEIAGRFVEARFAPVEVRALGH